MNSSSFIKMIMKQRVTEKIVSSIPFKEWAILLLLTFSAIVFGQSITVETCQEKARANYPLVKQYGLVDQTAQYNLSNANKGYLPQLTLSAKGTYQSEVTGLPAALMQKLGMSANEMSKDQYQATLEATQVVWDGGVIDAQKKVTKASTEVEKQKLEVDLYALNERVNQAFFGVLLLNEQLNQNKILQNELTTNRKRIEAMTQNGVANQTDLDAIKVEQLNAKQREAELIGTRKSYFIVLNALTGLVLDDNTELTKPEIDLAAWHNETNHRPELSFFEAQNRLFETQKGVLNASNKPKIGLFAQAGYGKPGLNMLSNAFSDFYIGGLRLSWNFSGFYTQKNNLNKIEISKKTTDIQRETFLFNSNLKTKQQQTEVEKLQTVIKSDDEIIQLRGNIKKSTSVKIENGTSTVNDLIREINAENQAKQLKSLHEVQLILAVYQLKNNLNN
jgi:outer membrane protein TolC